MKNNRTRYQSMLCGLTAGMALSTPALAGDMLDEVSDSLNVRPEIMRLFTLRWTVE